MENELKPEKLLAIFIEERDKFAIAFCEYMKDDSWWEEAHKGPLTIDIHLEIFKLSYNKTKLNYGTSRK